MSPVSQISGEGKEEFSRKWGPGFDQEGRGGTGRAAQSVGEKYKYYPVSRAPSGERAERSRGWGKGGEEGGAERVCYTIFFRSHRCRGLLYAWY